MVLVRPRTAADLPGCVEALSEVHESDDYPHRWPNDPAEWLTPENMTAACVAEYEHRIVGHVVIVDRLGALWVSRLFVRPEHLSLARVMGPPDCQRVGTTVARY